MKIFDIYLFKNLFIATLFIAIVLAMIVFLTQSLRFLELVMNAGTSGSSFWILTLLALPRFFEVILPIAVMAATLFTYNKMIIDSELTAMSATGYSSFSLSRPAIILGIVTTITLWGITFWLAPICMAKMQKMRSELTTEFSTLLFREGVFNPLGTGLTVYIKERSNTGELAGLMIHDARDESKPPSTVLAKRGTIVINNSTQQVVVFDGSRQQLNPETGILQNLAFDRYTIDLPDNSPTGSRWVEPDERTLSQLLNPDKNNPSDLESLHDFSIEIHRRFTSPLLAFAFPLIALTSLLLGTTDRRGQTKRIALAIFTIIIIQSLFIASYNVARTNNVGIIFMYLLTLLPILSSLFFLSGYREKIFREVSFPPTTETIT